MSSSYPEDLLFHEEHLWVRRLDETSEAVVGASYFAQKQLGGIVFVDLPRIGTSIEAGVPFGTVESHKVVSDLISPASGDVLEVNEALRSAAGLLNEDCYGAGWLVKIRLTAPSDIPRLLTAAAYRARLRE